MLAKIVAKKAKCHQSTINRLLITGKLKGSKIVNKKTGRMTWDVTTPIIDVIEIVEQNAPRHGYKKTRNKIATRSGSLLQSVIEWRTIPETKRAILVQLAKCSAPELKLLLELARS